MNEIKQPEIRLVNPEPMRSAHTGSTVYVYNRKDAIVSATINSSVMGINVLRLSDGTVASYKTEELFLDRDQAEQELSIRLHPAKQKALSEMTDVKSLLLFCIQHDFTKEDASDITSAVSIRASALLGVDPFEGINTGGAA